MRQRAVFRDDLFSLLSELIQRASIDETRWTHADVSDSSKQIDGIVVQSLLFDEGRSVAMNQSAVPNNEIAASALHEFADRSAVIQNRMSFRNHDEVFRSIGGIAQLSKTQMRSRKNDQTAGRRVLIGQREKSLHAASLWLSDRILIDVVPTRTGLPTGIVSPIAKEAAAIEGDEQFVRVPNTRIDLLDATIRTYTPHEIRLADAGVIDDTVRTDSGPTKHEGRPSKNRRVSLTSSTKSPADPVGFVVRRRFPRNSREDFYSPRSPLQPSRR